MYFYYSNKVNCILLRTLWLIVFVKLYYRKMWKSIIMTLVISLIEADLSIKEKYNLIRAHNLIRESVASGS